jgi:hypothetical protein
VQLFATPTFPTWRIPLMLARDMAMLPMRRPSQDCKLSLTKSVSAGVRAGNCKNGKPFAESILTGARQQ